MLSDIKKTLVFVESPFQMSNLLDLAEYRPTNQFHVIVRLNGIKKNDDSILRLLKSNSKPNVEACFFKISSSGKRKFLEMLALLPCLPAVLKASNVIFFDDRSLLYKVFSRLVHGKIILADDGAYTFSKISMLENKRDKKIIGFITRFSGLESNNIEVLHVPYEKRKVTTSPYTLVVGMPLFEKGIVSEENHLNMIRIIVDKVKFYTGNAVYYFPHRGEKSYKKLDLSVIESDLSVEEYIESVSEKAPSHVVSMYSTALFVVSEKFYGPQCYYYRLPGVTINYASNSNNISAVYEALKKSSCKELL